MPVGTQDKFYEDDNEYWREQLFGSGYNKESDTYEAPKIYGQDHGETKANEEDIVHGWTQHQMTDKGIDDINKAAEFYKDKKITGIQTSDLPRARQTANILSKTLDVPVVVNPALRTWDTGDLDGTQKHSEVDKLSHETPDVVPPGSTETFNQFKSRIMSAMVGIQNTAQGNTIAVTHTKPIGVIQGAGAAGWPDDGSIHMSTYEKMREKNPGGHEELDRVPDEVASAQAASVGASMLWDKYQKNIVEPSKEAHREDFPHWAGLADMLDPLQLPENAKNAVVGTFHAVNNQRLRMNDILGKDIGMSPEERHELWNPTNMALDHMALWGIAGAFGKVEAGSAGANAFRVKPREGGARTQGFDILDTDGNRVGKLPGYYDSHTKSFHVGYLDVDLPTPDELSTGRAAELNSAAHALGPGATLAGLRALAIEFPDIESVQGTRVSGYRSSENYDRVSRGGNQVVRIPEYIKEEARDIMSKAKEDPMGIELKDIAQERLKEKRAKDQASMDRYVQAPSSFRDPWGNTQDISDMYTSTVARRPVSRTPSTSSTISTRSERDSAYPNSGGQVPYFNVEGMLHDMNFLRADLERSLGYTPLYSEIIPHEVEVWRRDYPDMLVHDVRWWQEYARDNGHFSEWSALREMGETRHEAGAAPAVFVGNSGHYLAYGQREGYTQVAERGSDGNLTRVGPIAYASGDEKVAAAAESSKRKPRKPGYWEKDGEGVQYLKQAVKENKSQAQMAREMDTNEGHISRLMKKYNLKSKDGRIKKDLDYDKIEQMLKEGKSQYDVAKELGVNQSTIHRGLAQRGSDSVSPYQGDPSRLKDVPDWFRDEMSK